ncbi:MAG: DUF4325 domain-containing protein [Anaeroplasmataceae bacterium]|nr:DUF4325 domain-containing protein [Anaeroplasmataceae bacterium]
MLNYHLDNDTYVIEITNLRSIQIINDIIKLLNKLKNEDCKKIKFDFCNLHNQSYSPIHVTIVGIAQFYTQYYDIEITFVGRKNQYFIYTLKNYFENNKSELEENIFDKVIAFNSNEDVEFISNQILTQLKDTVTCNHGVLIGLSWCMNEIMDNVLNHSKSISGYIMVQVHKRNKHISISIYDTGIGLKNSLSKSNEYNPSSEVEAIELAIQKGVTCDRVLGQGNGLWGLNQIICANKGFLSIMSGHTEARYDYLREKKKIIDSIPIINDQYLTTRVDFTINFNNLINVSEALENYIPYEKISRDVENMINISGWICFDMLEQSKDEGTGTRSSGKKLRQRLLNILQIENLPVLIDFSNIESITSSFADEFIGKLISEIGFVQFSSNFRIVNANDFISNLINKAILERQIQKNS